jgi:hypothetical protein
MAVIKEFSADLGRYATAEESKKMFENSKQERERRNQKNKDYTHSQFFGKEKLLQLLDRTGEDCVGLKISLVIEDGESNESLMVQAVDKNGKVLPVKEPTDKGGSGGGVVSMYGGPRCPNTCVPPMETPD